MLSSRYSPDHDETLNTTLQARIAELEQQLQDCRLELDRVQQQQQTGTGLSNIFEDAIAAIGCFYLYPDQNWQLESVSPGCQSVFGYTAAEFLADKHLWYSRIHPEDLAEVIPPTLEVFSGEHLINRKYQFFHKDNSLRWIAEACRFRWDEQAQRWIVTTVAIDVTGKKWIETDRKQAEAALRESQVTIQWQLAEIEAIYASAPIGLCFLDTNLRYVRINQMLAEFNGFSVAEHIGRTLHEVLPGLADQLEPIYRQVLESRSPVLNIEVRGTTAAQPGVAHDWLVSFHPQIGADDEVLGVNVMVQEITERKQAEAALQQRTEREQAINRVVQAIHNSLDLDSIFTTATREIGEVLQTDTAYIIQYLPEQGVWVHAAGYLRHPELDSQLTPIPDANNPVADQLKQRKVVRLADTEFLTDEVHWSFVEQHPSARLLVPLPNLITDHHHVWGSLSLMRSPLLPWQDWEVEIAQAIVDQLAIAIHQASLFQQVQQFNQELEQRVQEHTTQLQLALSAAKMGIWEADLVTNQQYWSPENYALLGFCTDEQGRVLDQNGTELSPAPTFELFKRCVHPDDLPGLIQHEQQMFESTSTGEKSATKPWEYEHRNIWFDGTIRWRYTRSSFIFDEHSQPIKIAGISMDITERKQAELALNESQERFSKVFHASPIGIAITTFPGSQLLDANESFLQLLGYQRHEVIGKTTLELSLWDSSEARNHWMEALTQGQSVRNLEVQFRNSAGIMGTGILALELIELGGQPCLLKMLYDISDRKQSEAILQLQAQILNQIHDAVISTSLDGTIQTWNLGAENLYGYKAEEAIGMNVSMLYPPEDLSLMQTEVFQPLLATGSHQVELRNLTKSGTLIHVSLRLSVVYDKIGNPIRLIGCSDNISDRKQAEEKIRSSLKEKEVLLKEIHHRVKNNLQIINSLLRMQSQQIENHQFADLLRTAQNRIHSMALIHEQLYQAPDLAGIDFSHYLQSLITNLFRSYREDSHQVIPAIEAESITLSVDTAIPCGLIVNELVTNALKYAFPNQQAGEIRIRLYSTSDEANGRLLVFLTVSDNGIGIPPSLDLETTESLGLAIVSGLVSQINGIITLNREHGTHFHITFPKP